MLLLVASACSAVSCCGCLGLGRGGGGGINGEGGSGGFDGGSFAAGGAVPVVKHLTGVLRWLLIQLV